MGNSASSTGQYIDIIIEDSNSSTCSNSISRVGDNVTSPRFYLFPWLPAELRLKIWVMAIEPRIVEVRFNSRGGNSSHEFLNPIPAILHANSESRTECLKYYQLSSQDSNKAPTKYSQNALNCFYFNCEIDTLYIPKDSYIESLTVLRGASSLCDLFFAHNECGILEKVQKIAVDGFRNHASTVRYFSKENAPSKVVLVNQVPAPCFGNHFCERRGPWCFMKFNDLKAALEHEKDKKVSWVDMERIGMLRWEKNFKYEWKECFGEELSCPEVQSRVLYRKECLSDRSLTGPR